MRAPLRLLAACGLLELGSASVARAYSDPATFAAPVLEAGGGGRFYTGSPAEGYGCDSCHRAQQSDQAQQAPAIELRGLPTRYVPRATYELRVTWSHELANASAALEVTDERGLGVGTLALPPAGLYEADESCEPKDAALLAAQLYAASGERVVAATPDCGAFMLRVQWTAPERSVGPVWVAGSVLASNHDGSFDGDGTTHFARAIPPLGSDLPQVATRGGCSVAGLRASDGPCALALLLLAALGLWRWSGQRGLRSIKLANTKRRCS